MNSRQEVNNITLIFCYVFCGSILLFLIDKYSKQLRIFLMLNKFPKAETDDYSVIFGHLKTVSQTTDRLFKVLREFSEKYYPYYRLRVMHRNNLFILSPEDCEIILGSTKHTRKSFIYRPLENWLQEGLLLSEGYKWTKRRKILTPTFHFNILKSFLNIFHDHTDKVIEILLKKNAEPINVCPLASEFALLVINETAMGYRLDSKNEEQKKYRDSIQRLEKLITYRAMRPWLYEPLFYFFSPLSWEEKPLLKTLHIFTRNIIKNRMKSFTGISEFLSEEEDDVYMGKKKKRLAMLDILIQAERDCQEINYEGICEEVDTFMFEGHDTTAASIGFFFMLIANHPDIQEKIYEEIRGILGVNQKKASFEELQKMELLERCIKECLRLYPSVHFISRFCEEDTVLSTGLMLPKDAIVHIPIFDVLRNPRVFPNPNKFDPDRFLPDNCKNRHPFAFIPFSAGPRNCIGQRFALLEIKALMSGIIQRFNLLPVDTPDTVALKGELILRAENGIKVIFKSRN